MDKKEFFKTYNSLQEGKKMHATIIKFYIVSATIIIIGCFIFMYASQKNIADKIKVVDSKGELLSSKTATLKDLKMSLIESHCEKTIYYANSFAQLTIKPNQAKTKFLMNQRDANKIFETYLKNGKYADAIQRGYDCEARYIKVNNIDISKEPYKVSFVSELTINDGENITKYIIFSNGEIVNTIPQYPENPFGLFFKRYEQELKFINDEDK